MAGKGESEKQLLTLIRDFASERSNGERRLAALRKQIEEQSKEFEAASAALEDLKLQKEKVEQEVKGCEVELSMNNASIQTFEKRIARIEDAILDVGISIDELKNVEETLREGFVNQMLTKNAEIRCRELKEIKGSTLKVNDQSCLSSSDEFKQVTEGENVLDAITILNKLTELISQLKIEEEQYEAEQSIYKEVQQEFIDVEKKLSLMEGVTETNKELAELAKLQMLKGHVLFLVKNYRRKVCARDVCRINLDAIQKFLQ